MGEYQCGTGVVDYIKTKDKEAEAKIHKLSLFLLSKSSLVAHVTSPAVTNV